MLFKVVSLFLLASTILAIPSKLGARVARRRANRQSQIINRLEQVDSATSDELYSNNQAGAVWNKGDHTFASVTGTFVVPTPSGNYGDSASAWVGIDGITCTSAMLRTGVDFTDFAGGPAYTAWYQFYPGPIGYYLDITITAGDVVQLNVTTSSPSFGAVTIDNLTRNESESLDLFNSQALCGQECGLMVLLPFANFGMVTFTDAYTTGTGTYTPSGATIVDIEQNGQVLTSTSTNGSSVTIQYV
ncbi:peptidase A4 family-domain-containing protein [Boletus edulis]|nr:peptidase A4 family-domain-containing protein [Boletus edulis]